MSSVNIEQAAKNILKILQEKPRHKKGNLLNVVRGIREKSAKIKRLAEIYGTPLYVVDGEALRKNIRNFSAAFRKYLPECRFFYAMKANHHPLVIKAVLKGGYGIDVSSGRELGIALAAGAKEILFSGPGKTTAEHALALKYNGRVTVNIDSFGELKRLGELAASVRKTIRAGVRIYLPFYGGWSKFGIPLDELKRFWAAAGKYKYIRLEGIQFHISWNRQPSKYVEMIKRISAYLKESFTAAQRSEIKFIDFGGGYFPDRAEGYYPWTAHYPGAWPGGKIVCIADSYLGTTTGFKDKYYITTADPVEKFAKQISAAIGRHLKPLLDCDYYTEPGRIIVNDTMHVVVRITDCKRKGFVISDGGVNIIGWEYGESFYFPMVNLTHPSLKEIKCTVTGPLCTPHDTWGQYCYASKMEEGDLIVVANQGAYKYALAQNFIKPVPEARLMA